MSQKVIEAHHLVRRYHEAWSRRRFSEAVALLAEDLLLEVRGAGLGP